MRFSILLPIAILLVAGCAGQTEEEKDSIISLALTNADFKDLCYGLSLDNPNGLEKVVSMKYEKEGSGEIYEVRCLSERVFTDGTYACAWLSTSVNTTARTVQTPTASDEKSRAGKCSEQIFTTPTSTTMGPQVLTKEDALNTALLNNTFKTECEKIKLTNEINYTTRIYSGKWMGYSVTQFANDTMGSMRFYAQCGIGVTYEDINMTNCYYVGLVVGQNGKVEEEFVKRGQIFECLPVIRT